MSEDDLARIDSLFSTDLTTLHTPWNELNVDAGNPTLTHLRDLVAHQRWLASQAVGTAALAGIPPVKVRHFAEEARALDAGRMQALELHKRMTLAVALLGTQAARALDDLGEMFVRRMQHIHNAAKLALDRYRAASVERTDTLITTLHELLLAHQGEGSVEMRFAAMDAVIAPRADELLEACEAHLAYAGSNYFRSSGVRTGVIAPPYLASLTHSPCDQQVRTPASRGHCGFFRSTPAEQVSGSQSDAPGAPMA
ncbi:MAG: hypothetical protein JOZ87_22540 [Chloroflexi bacterium]|nr:hypothetical protein [Chloroflexota bacterium]